MIEHTVVGAFLIGLGTGGIITAVALAVAHYDDRGPRLP